MVVKMLVAKDPNLEKQLQVPLRENLGEIRERCLEDLKHFISELDEAVRQQEPSVCDSTTPPAALMAHKPLKPGVNHSSSYWQTQNKLSNFGQARTVKGATGWQMQRIRWINFGLLNGFTAQQCEDLKTMQYCTVVTNSVCSEWTFCTSVELF